MILKGMSGGVLGESWPFGRRGKNDTLRDFPLGGLIMYPSHGMWRSLHRRQSGFVSSHLTRRSLLS